jgi:hypothetical protein
MVTGIGVYTPFIKYYKTKLPFIIKVFMHICIGVLICAMLFVILIAWDLIIGKNLIDYVNVLLFKPEPRYEFLPFTIFYSMLFSFGIWGGSYLYYKIEAKIINKKLKKIQNDYKK